MKIILGTASEWRQKIFREMEYDFEVEMAEIDEKLIRSNDLKKLPLLIARAKAEKLKKKTGKSGILVTLDEIVVFEGIFVEVKPLQK
ncbi:MAG: Maf family protein [Candidatus Moranbacteria bacterium]|nr:Maf family protein [Candidatus Moranbacteria bacterium]